MQFLNLNQHKPNAENSKGVFLNVKREFHSLKEVPRKNMQKESLVQCFALTILLMPRSQ